MILPHALEVKLTAYREQKKEETGKRCFRDTAIIELLAKALDGIEPPKPLSDRVTELERRVGVIETIPRGNCVEVGDIDDAITLPRAMLIQFATEDEVRAAMDSRQCTFTLFEPTEKVSE